MKREELLVARVRAADTPPALVGVDTGFMCGLCVIDAAGKVLAVDAFDKKPSMLLEEFAKLVTDTCHVIGPRLALEEPVGTRNMRTYGSQWRLYGAIAMRWWELEGAPVLPVSTTEAKKALTGRGVAPKPVMVSAALERGGGVSGRIPWPGSEGRREAAADAVGVALAAWAQMRRVVRTEMEVET